MSAERIRALVALSCACAIGGASAAEAETILEQVTVTGTREKERLVETPASVGAVKAEALAADKPAHPAQVMSQIPGAAVAVTNGEGHTTAIRQPFTTSPVYLFLEDGIPSRSPGFFNHNALYEINVPQAGGIEVNRGPSSALYGSDAIGGVVNVLTRVPPTKTELGGSVEIGEHGWRRALLSGGSGYASGGFRADLNLSATDGWRDDTAYDRKSGTLRWDHFIGDSTSLKTVLGFSEIDQDTGANSPLVREDYKHDPTRNYLPIAFRKVSALRLSTSFEHETADSLLSITPYVRDNSMDLLASFALRFDPSLAETRNQSYGLMAKWRQDFAPMRARLIAGVDLDMSPGSRRENRINATMRGSGASQEFIDYTLGPRIYDYDVEYRGISPYLHGEISPTDRLRLTAGLRYDDMRYAFRNDFAAGVVQAGSSFYGQAADSTVSFRRATPKFGATYALDRDTHLFASYNQGFRAPSESQLFRPSRATSRASALALAQSAVELDAIRAEQFEFGIRGVVAGVSYDLVAYDLTKRDDIVSQRDPETTQTITTNAGKTRHRGIELGLGAPLHRAVRLDVAMSYAWHEFEDWETSQGDFGGNEQASAPRFMSNTRLTWAPTAAIRAQLEWSRIGSYWLDDANTVKYGGHNLFNLRGNYALNPTWSLFGSVQNLTDKRYAESAQLSTRSTPVYSPGLPRTVIAGVEAKW
ncbi:MAG: iron complex outermembrane recepter protein [Azoarcus sp.]|uniref:Outer membrane receptor proteins, mostly Fe transport n=1 Tax=Aromatoleum tolulyticum TaxID=34027 RepID=A0A1N6TYF9_9RHOO|nr:TonB-dependent receptor [Aromatoleum tolulyticum]MCK9983591.1 iron complex outermembrane recepter protein [Azoarcus sp.]SIQ58126.1 Outer membrane receptor proteins, mostly Fe transport [Aromatoleum tolulyticum]